MAPSTTAAPLGQRSDSHGVADPAATEHPTALAFGLAAPHAVVDPLLERILEAGVGHRALGTDALSGLYADAVTRKENGGGQVSGTFPRSSIPCPLVPPSSSRRLRRDPRGLPRALLPSPSVTQLVSHFEPFCSAKWAGIDGFLTIFL